MVCFVAAQAVGMVAVSCSAARIRACNNISAHRNVKLQGVGKRVEYEVLKQGENIYPSCLRFASVAARDI
jgi:hypothetical protein